MQSFSYEIIDNQGRISAGQLKADSLNQAVIHLQGMGYSVIDIKESKKVVFDLQLLKTRKKVPIGEISLFSRQLAAMLQAGIPLTQCLFVLAEQTSNPALKKAVEDVAANVEAGMSFGEALEKHPSVFSKLFVGMVKSGELGGTLDNTLLHLSDQLQKDKTLRDNIRSATFYPSMVGIFAILVMLLMLIFIVPIFIKMFPPGTKLPLPTRMVIAASDSLRQKWYLWILFLSLFVGGMKYFFSSAEGSIWAAKLKFDLPFFGPLLQKATIAGFTRTLATLLSGGIPVLQALEVSGEATGNPLISNALYIAKERVEEGGSLAEPLEESKLFPPMVIQMVAIGEQSGSLVTMLNKVSEFFEEEVAIMTKGLSAMLEPLLLAFVGITVGLMVISLYLPIFNAVTQVGI